MPTADPRRPALSVVLPVRDVAAYLPDTLTSLERNAAAADLQLIVVDDGSVDGTSDLVTEFADSRAWVEPVRHDRALGLADARNAGLDRATGRYVTFLDGDDWLAPGYLVRLVAVIDTLGCDFVRTDHVQVRGRERVVHYAPEWRREVVLDPASGILPAHRRTMVDYPYAWAGVYRRELGDLLRFDAGLQTAEDRPWIWRLHARAESYAVTSLAGLFYRREVSGSLTAIDDGRQLDFLRAYTLLLAEARTGERRAKAVRQFLAVLRGHVASDRYTPVLRTRLETDARTLLASVDAQTLAHALPADLRDDPVAPLLPGAVLELR